MIITDERFAARRRQHVYARLRRAIAARRTMTTIAISLVALSVAGSAMAGTTSPRPVHITRDHRDDNVKYVRPNWARDRDPGWGNYGKGKGDGPTVRDHRR
jgi:hypothetical protein